jgi:hypothetical protein
MRKFGIFICSFALWQLAEAQTLPPACEQYISALEACTQNATDFYERTDISYANKMKESLKMYRKLRVDLNKLVVERGEDAIAERCTTPEFIRESNDGISGLATLLMFSHALDRKCERKIKEIRVIVR